MVGDDLNIDRMGVIILNIAQCLLHIRDLFFFRRDVCPWEFTRQEVKIFIKDAVHHEVAVFRKLVRFKHFFMAQSDTVVLPVVEIRRFQKRGSFQILFDLDTLETNPGIGSWIVLIRFIVNQRIGTDQKGISLGKMVKMSVCFINAFSF